MRTKPRVPERKNTSQEDGCASMEVELALSGLKDKNRELVKRVAKLEQDLHDLNQDRFTLQRKYMELKVQCNCAARTIPEIEDLMKSCTPMFVSLMERIMKVIDLCKAKDFKGDLDMSGGNSNNKGKDLKTQAVQPHTVNGTVLLSPRISLKRLSDVPLNRRSTSRLAVDNNISDSLSPELPAQPNGLTSGVTERHSSLELRRITELRNMPSTSSSGNNSGVTSRINRNKDASRNLRETVTYHGENQAAEIEPDLPENDVEDEEDINETVLPEEESVYRLSVIAEESTMESPSRQYPQLTYPRTSSIEAESDDRTFQALESFLEASAFLSDMSVLRNLPSNTNDTVPTPRLFSPQSNSTRVDTAYNFSESSSRVEHWPSNCLESFLNGSTATRNRTNLQESREYFQKTTPTLHESSDDESNDISIPTPSASELGDRDASSKFLILQGLGLEPSGSSKSTTPLSSPVTRLSRRSRNLQAELTLMTNSDQKENTAPNNGPIIISQPKLPKELVILLKRSTEIGPSPRKLRKSSSGKVTSTPPVKKKKTKKKKPNTVAIETKTEDTIKDIKRRLSDYMPDTSKQKVASPLKIKTEGRPKRAARPANLKDSSLKKKMRRS